MIQSEEYEDDFYQNEDGSEWEDEEENDHPACWSCGGEGEWDGWDDDPLWYDPGSIIKCDVCKGKGYLADDDE